MLTKGGGTRSAVLGRKYGVVSDEHLLIYVTMRKTCLILDVCGFAGWFTREKLRVRKGEL